MAGSPPHSDVLAIYVTRFGKDGVLSLGCRIVSIGRRSLFATTLRNFHMSYHQASNEGIQTFFFVGEGGEERGEGGA